MKPEDLKPPFDWKSPLVTIYDRVLYVPEYHVDYDRFTFPGWSSPAIFGNDNPIHVEYCSGNGTWIAAKAAANPHINWVAVERRFVRVRKIWSKAKNQNLSNLFIICGEAYSATSRYFPADSVSQVFINFPDPWPKRRHGKHRLIQPAFLDQINRIGTKDQAITLVTDDPNYSTLAIEEVHDHGAFHSGYASPFYITEMANYGTSYFEELWREKGRVIRYHYFQKSVVLSAAV